MPTLAQGGPPLLTDDPGTPGAGNWEINIAYALERNRGDLTHDLPLMDLNYGLGENIQFKYEVAWTMLDEQGAGLRSGLSNSLAGVKWRFLDQGAGFASMSLYPQVEFNNPTNSVERGLAEHGPNYLLPLEISRTAGPWSLGLELGRWFNQDRPDQWTGGVVVALPASESLELLAEIHGSFEDSSHDHEEIINVGLRKELAKSWSLLASAGTGFGTDELKADVLMYVGVQWRNR